jgi:hypothetical protein
MLREQGGDQIMTEVAPETRELPVVTCTGTPQERGAQHGEALRGHIAQGLGAWGDAIGERHGTDPDAYIRQFVQGTNFLDAIRQWTPDLEGEIAGIARGANQPWEWVYAYNLLDEEWTWARQIAAAGRGCTAVGLAPAGRPPLLAQTMDIPRVHDGTQAVLRVAGNFGPEVTVFTYAGMVGLTGCNSAGVALVVNNLDMLPGSLTGLPVACVIRGILNQETRQAATEFALRVPHATGQHYGIAAPDGVASIEGWANGVAASSNDDALLHTNHPLYADEPVGDVEARYQWSRTRERLAFIESEVASCQDVSGLQHMLADRTVPVSIEASRGSMTFGAVIYECAVPPRMWVTPGPPHLHTFQHVSQELEPATV